MGIRRAIERIAAELAGIRHCLELLLDDNHAADPPELGTVDVAELEHELAKREGLRFQRGRVDA